MNMYLECNYPLKPSMLLTEQLIKGRNHISSTIKIRQHEAHTLMTVSKVTLASMLVEAVFGMEVSLRASSFSDLRLQQKVSRGRVFLKMLTIRIFTGNMMREL